MNRVVSFLIFFVLFFFLFRSFSGSGSDRGGLAVGQPVPDIAAAGWVNGDQPTLDGKVVVIDAWATWCGPCRAEAPKLVETYQKFEANDDVVFIGLTSEDATALPDITNFLEETGITWPNGYGARETLTALEANYIPSVWVVDRSGKIAWNYGSSGNLDDAIENALQ